LRAGLAATEPLVIILDKKILSTGAQDRGSMLVLSVLQSNSRSGKGDLSVEKVQIRGVTLLSLTRARMAPWRP
jgi:hypothetical protein